MAARELAPAPEFFRWEDLKAGDLPYYRGSNQLSWPSWLLILLGVGLGLWCDLNVNAIATFTSNHVLRIVLSIVAIVAVPGFPLLGLWLAARSNITALFRRLTKSSWRVIGAVIIISYIYSLAMVGVLKLLNIPTSADAGIATDSAGTKASLLDAVGTVIQLPFLLFGEELFMILPFLFLLAVLTRLLSVPRKPAIVVAAILAGLLFGLYHYHAYDWNLAQMFLVIGLGHVIVLWAYVKTRNIWVPYLIHLIYDVIILGMSIVVDGATLLNHGGH